MIDINEEVEARGGVWVVRNSGRATVWGEKMDEGGVTGMIVVV